MLRLLQIRLRDRAADDPVHARVDQMVHRRQRAEERGVAPFVPDIGDGAVEIGVVDFVEDGVDFGLRGGDDGDVGAVLEQGEGGAVADAAERGFWSAWCCRVGVVDDACPELPPTTTTFLPTSLSFELGIFGNAVPSGD